MRYLSFLLISVFFCVCLLQESAYAEGSLSGYGGAVATNNVVARLVSEQSVVRAGSRFSLALELAIRDGWHTYWRNPGDSGQATSITWDLPEGVIASEIQWPFPERQYVGPVANYGYHGVALHLIEMQVADDWPEGQPIEISAEAKWLVCEEECIPEKARLTYRLQTSANTIATESLVTTFAGLRASIPQALDVASTYQYAGSDNQTIRLEFSPTPALVSAKAIEYFPLEWGFISAPSKQQLVIDDAFVSITTQKGDVTFSESTGGVIVVSDANGAKSAFSVESWRGPLMVQGPSTATNANETNGALGIVGALLFAIIGGVILNLMPCVFPVLFMKALSLVAHKSAQAKENRRHGLAYAFGILASFALLGVGLMALKSGGQQIGWGFQLQSPLFVGVIALVLFTLGLSLSGMLDVGSSLMNSGSSLANKPGYQGSFFTGVLAVVVATPCTAPFMGPAIGFALTQSAPVTISVLLALGFGLSLPYLILSFVPAFTRFLPKPGVWMQRFQQLLAFPMYVSAAWLVWVFGQQAGINGVFTLLLAFILTAFVVWVWPISKNAKPFWKQIGQSSAVVVVLCIIGLFATQFATTTNKANSNSLIEPNNVVAAYQAFNPNELTHLRDQGKPVFVNMTAAWCITCLANEKVALSTPEVASHFDKHDITYMKGDWTNQDAIITDYLSEFGRASVPLYVYYPPNHGKPKVLPQILTVATVIKELSHDEL